MKYKIGDKVNIVATDEELNRIAIVMDQWAFNRYKDRKNKLYTITDIQIRGIKYGGLICPYSLDDGAYFPEKYLRNTREYKLKRILNEPNL